MKKNQNEGITLIALVITIIILLILAGIAIATLTGENGILSKANTAKEVSRKSNSKRKSRSSSNGELWGRWKIELSRFKNKFR